MKQCKRCKVHKERKDYPDYKALVCKACNVEKFRLSKFNLTQSELDEMWYSQDGLCVICRDELTESYHIDHCHTTNKVRGLLCRHCNIGLGQFKDNIQSLQNAINYLNKTS